MSWFNKRIAVRLIAVAGPCGTDGRVLPADVRRAERDRRLGPAREAQGVEVPPLNLPNGSREARLGVEIRNNLMFSMYGSAVGGPPTPPSGDAADHNPGCRSSSIRPPHDPTSRTTVSMRPMS